MSTQLANNEDWDRKGPVFIIAPSWNERGARRDLTVGTLVAPEREERLLNNWHMGEFNPFTDVDKLKKENVFVVYTDDNRELFLPREGEGEKERELRIRDEWKALVSKKEWQTALIGNKFPALTDAPAARTLRRRDAFTKKGATLSP